MQISNINIQITVVNGDHSGKLRLIVSGDFQPSEADRRIHEQLADAASFSKCRNANSWKFHSIDLMVYFLSEAPLFVVK